jgi:hypothetical protein
MLCLLAVLLTANVQSADPIKLKLKDTPVKAVILPQELLDALMKIEGDKQDSLTADAAISVAQVALDDGTKAKATAETSKLADVAAYWTIWTKLYGPPPVPQPPGPPQPPQPPPEAKDTLSLITTNETANWCQACVQVRNDTLPGLKTKLGDHLAVLEYTTDAAKKLYPESALVPRWHLLRADGKVEKKVGYLSLDQVNAWLSTVGAKP